MGVDMIAVVDQMTLQERQHLLRGSAPLFEYRLCISIDDNDESIYEAIHEE